MLPGVVGFSLLFELLVFYYALHLLWPNTPRHWVYLLVALVALVVVFDITGARWVEVFNGHFEFFWTQLFEKFGFR